MNKMMTRIDQFKENLGKGEIIFLEKYLSSICEFIKELQSKKLLANHTKEKIDTMQKFIRSSNAPQILLNTFYNIIGEVEESDKKIDYLRKAGFDTKLLPEQIGSIICHSYQVKAERFKLYLVTLINFSKLGKQNADKESLGPLLTILKREFPKNKFVNYFTTTIRNPVTHYTYYFEKGDICLCNGYYDARPKKLTLAQFIIESKELNILVEAFLFIYLDNFAGPGKVVLV